ncbi:sensor histidine kinase [Carbonactinospora thermoautotrophica]|uniref:sensor histidine kinase n=1 Tax=Carbonactinospora thermoautotrophica TaxID=1469144 RepID=UPI0027E1E298|nr:GAF domain-containing sensor histidine kinase [Carbonactinospora thermoautotrophica]
MDDVDARGGAGDSAEERRERPHVLPRLRLDELLGELQARLQEVMATRDRVHRLLEAVLAVGSDLDLGQVLQRIVEAAVTLVDARYGALGVLGEDGRITRFIPVGVDEGLVTEIGHPPLGQGVLGRLTALSGPLRLADVTQHPEAAGFPPGHPPMKSFLGVPVRVRGEVFGNLYLTDKRGGAEFDAEDEEVLVALAAAAGVAIENARLYEEARQREQWLAAVGEVTRALLSGAGWEEVLGLLARRAREMVGADAAGVALPDRERRMLVLGAVEGVCAEQVRNATVPVEGSLPGRVLSAGEAIAVATGDAGVGAPVGPMVAVPLGAADRTRGVLYAWRKVGGESFPAAAVQLLAVFAEQVAVALELAERRRDAERLTVLEDRDRIARDLHDLVIQRLFATGMVLEGAIRLIDSPEAAARVMRAVDNVDETIKEIRATIFALHSRGEQPGRAWLRGRIVETVEEATPALGFAPALRMEGLLDSQVPEQPAEHLLAALREALSNAARHAKASRVEVAVEAGAELRLTVRDDGVGIPPGAARSGLRNLQQRAEQLGGGLRLSTPPTGGTELIWWIPLEGTPG